VIDLDQTLIYARPVEEQTASLNDSSLTSHSYLRVSCHETTTRGEGGGLYQVYKRPHLDQFLAKLSRHGELHIFTAATRGYADPIIDQIDPHGYITGRYYREHCQVDKGKVVKDMSVITKNVQRLIIIDDCEQVANRYKENTILVEAWAPNRKKDIWLNECVKIVN
jgi:Dullard-like phosphatase family protein